MDARVNRDTLANLARLLSPATVAVVGANEQLAMSNNAVLPMLEAGRDVALVNPRRDTLYGRGVHADLSSIGSPIDAVLALVNAERSIAVVEEAAEIGCGGVVVSAAGFAEAGDAGADLQRRLLDVARRTGIAVVGPNGAGFKNVPLEVNLFTGGRLDLPVAGVATVGGVSIVSQSGFLVRSAMAAAKERALGVSIAVSSGNEAVCDLADHVGVLTGDPHTSVICLVIETVRRPAAFFAAVVGAQAAGKVVIALKLGRSERARLIMQSHTSAIADESWVYDLAFREHGVVAASDIDELLDRAQLAVQLPPERHRRIGRIGMITTSGGVAALATDLADDIDAPLPPLPEIEAWVRERVPGDTVNPLDLTGFVMTKAELMEEVFDTYAGAVDALVLGWWTGGRRGLEPDAARPVRQCGSARRHPVRREPGGGHGRRSVGGRVARARPAVHTRRAVPLPSRRHPRTRCAAGSAGTRRACAVCAADARAERGRPDGGVRRRHGPRGSGWCGRGALGRDRGRRRRPPRHRWLR